jgi:hypothetical protein
MSLTLKTNVKVHFSAHDRAQNLPHIVPSQPNATGLSGVVPSEAKAELARFAEDFTGEHSSTRISIVPLFPLTGSIGANASDVPGSPKE